MSAPLLLVPLVTVLARLLLMSQPAQTLSIKQIFEIETCGPPQIQNTMLNQTKNPGESVHFRCQIDMSKCMVAFIDWYHDNIDGERRKVKSARSSRDPHTHEISRVEARDEGLYTCVVGNVLGNAEASAYLQVNSGGVRAPSLLHWRSKDITAMEVAAWLAVLVMRGRFMGNPLLILST